MQRFNGEVIFKLIQTATEDELKIPCKLFVIKKIHDWTQYYIHGGMVPYLWQIEWAHYLTEKIFAGDCQGETWSINGGIKIKKAYMSKIQNDVRKSFSKPKDIIVVKLKQPECFYLK